MVAVDKTDRLGLGPAFENLRAAAFERQILDQHDDIAIGKYIAVGVLDHARASGRFRFGRAFPLMTTGGAFPFVWKFQHVIHFAHRANRFRHKGAKNTPARVGVKPCE